MLLYIYGIWVGHASMMQCAIARPKLRDRGRPPAYLKNHVSQSEDGVSLKAFVDSVIFRLAILCCEVQIIS